MQEVAREIRFVFEEIGGNSTQVFRIACGCQNEGVCLAVELIENEPVDGLLPVTEDDAGNSIVVSNA